MKKTKEVLILFKTHLDVGFTDYAENVKEKYLTQYIPNAIAVARQLQGTDTPFVWTVGSWLIREALKQDDGTLEQAILDGLIRWHALPFTTHTEFMTEELLEEGLKISKELDQRFGMETHGAKMTDVPEPWFNLYNNIWNTNFPMWFGDDVKFRFLLHDRK